MLQFPSYDTKCSWQDQGFCFYETYMECNYLYDPHLLTDLNGVVIRFKIWGEEYNSGNVLSKLANLLYQICIYPHVLMEGLAVASGANHCRGTVWPWKNTWSVGISSCPHWDLAGTSWQMHLCFVSLQTLIKTWRSKFNSSYKVCHIH